jgi:hypothetical protein
MPDFSRLREFAVSAWGLLNTDLTINVRPWHVAAAAVCVIAIAVIL